LSCVHKATSTSPIITGASIKAQITAAKVAPLFIPNVAIAIAIASLKLFDAEVKESVAEPARDYMRNTNECAEKNNTCKGKSRAERKLALALATGMLWQGA
jgi:hypothetical protein